MEASSSSKVTVEYHDPSGVFPLISREFTNRLPLRNLNWQSHARPLRQIKHLHVDLVPSAETQAALRPQTVSNEAPPNSIDILRSGFEVPKPSTKERRHQIPGLKTTPYLKIYVLRCDDKDWYKQEERQKLKQWVRDIKDEDGRHEHHDAFEWLILHVVIPDTIAASEPRWRESSKDPDELKERSKGFGKSQKTVLDRLRTDFGDGKASHGHIAQIRLSKSEIAVDLLPVPALAKTVEESADEREKSWSDLMTKIRACLLASFDARVRQYEDDIAEQESRRSLPGWNFCTFFIHKEGLARALESVGLVEDALALYDELSLGLETVLGDIASGEAVQTATSFPSTGAHIVDRIVGDGKCSNDITKGHPAQRLFNKDYREEILRSAISIFDFFCYLFERQSSLILRLAGRAASTPVSGIKEGGDDLVMLAEVCWRGLSFIHNGARTLKQDLSQNMSVEDAQSLVLSWTYATADLVLTRTQSVHLDLTSAGSKVDSVNGHATAPRRPEFGFSMGADAYPQRHSSLPFQQPTSVAQELRSVTSASSASAGKLSEDGFLSPPSSSGNDGVLPATIPGLAELAAYRAELVALERKSLDLLAAMKGWFAGWTALAKSKSLPSIGLHSDEVNALTNGFKIPKLGQDVLGSLKTKTDYEAAFDTLTETTARHYLLATHLKSAENLMGDLAILKYMQHDYASAITYFEHALPILESDGWQQLHMKALALQCDSLRRVERYEDAVETTLKLLAKDVQQRNNTNSKALLVDSFVRDAIEIKQLLDLSKHLAQPLTVPFSRFFTNLELPPNISHPDDTDGFCYEISFRHVMQDVVVDAVLLHLVHVDHPSIELTLGTTGTITLTQGIVRVMLTINVSTFGMFSITHLEIKASNLTFRHDIGPKLASTELSLHDGTEEQTPGSKQRSHVLLYPRLHAFDVNVALSSKTAVHKARHITIQLDSGHNEVEKVDIRLKPASAGLRLYTDDTSVDGIDMRQSNDGQAGLISLSSMKRSTSSTISVRYSSELPLAELSLRAEVRYATAHGSFVALQHVSLATQLPLDVDVKDTFRLDALLSAFTIRTTNGEPVMLNNITLQDSDAYDVKAPPVTMAPTIVLARKPVECVYKITPKRSVSRSSKQDTALSISVACIPVSDLIAATIAAKLQESLTSSHFASLQSLLLPLIRPRCRATYTNADMDMAAILREAKVPSFTDLGWSEVIDTAPTMVQKPLADWLMKWHIEHAMVQLDLTELATTLQKHITISVDVPDTGHVFMSSVSLEASVGQKYSPNILMQGETSQLHANIRYTRKWAAVAGQGLTKSSRRPDFVYEVLADPDTWMLSGRTKASFAAAEAEGTITAALTIISLRAGIWPLPTVAIRIAAADASDDATVSFEASCTTAGQIVHVAKHEHMTRMVVLDTEKYPTVSSRPESQAMAPALAH